MSNAKKKPAHKGPQTKKAAPPPKGPSKTIWIAGVVVIAAIIAIVALSGGGKGGANATAGGPVAPAEEAKYIGRFLPQGYAEPQVAGGGAVTVDTPMTPITATPSDTGLSVAVADITSKRNVGFEYKKADGSVIPLIAYVKPSGKLFVGVSYCVPCKGTGQTLTTDGTLTCNSCGTKRDPETGVGISGACRLYPLDELPAQIVGGQLVIDKAALDGWTVQPLDRKVGA